MSGFFGIFRTDGEPVEPDDLIVMRDAMSCWGPSGSRMWSDGPIGLGHLMSCVTPESEGDVQPREDSRGAAVLAARVRLDNREDLFDSMGLPRHASRPVPDSGLILRAYEKWGADCTQRLLGDWAFAVWDPARQSLLLARDHCGTTGIYFCRRGQRFAFASSLKALTALPWIEVRPNLYRIARLCALWVAKGDTTTCYEGVHQLPPAHRLCLDGRGDRLERYWRLEDSPGIRLKTDDEYVHAFTEVFEEAVRCRLRSRGKIGISLSGGLDSGSVAAVAAKELAAGGRRLHALSAVPGFDLSELGPAMRAGDETAWIQATCRHIGNVDLHYATANDVSPVEAIRRMHDLRGEPGIGASNYPWLISRMVRARGLGIEVLLTGGGGNGTISWDGTGCLLRLFKDGRLGELLDQLKTPGGAYTGQSLRRFLGQVVRPMLPLGWYDRIRHEAAGHEPWEAYCALNPVFGKRLDLTGSMVRLGHDPDRRIPQDPVRHRFLIIRPGHDPSGALVQALGAGYGIEIRDPTMDRRVVEFCLGIPAVQYVHRGRRRWLIRRAMAGRLPGEVLWNPLRGIQGADIGHQIRAHYQETEEALTRIEKCGQAREVLDLPRMRSALESIRNRVAPESVANVRLMLMRGLDIGLFLAGF